MTLNDNKIFEDKQRNQAERFSDMLFDKSYTTLDVLNCKAYVSEEPLSFDERLSGNAVTLCEGDKWAENVFDCAWFHITGKLSEDISREDAVLILNVGGEGLLYDLLGNMVQSITCYSAEFGGGELGTPIKRIIPLYDNLTDGNKIDFWIDCGANDLFGCMENQSRVKELQLALVNREIRSLAFDVQVLLSVYDFSPDREFAQQVFAAIKEMMCCDTIDESTAIEYRARLAPLLAQKNDNKNVFTYSAMGHAHLDLAWLWPIRESKRKGARTFITQMRNMERYNDYIFGASQAQLYLWIKEQYPDLYEKVKAAADTPRWDVQGATWVEPDSNLIGSESMIRQFYYGKKFFKEEFGKDMEIFWVPDSFGYSGCLPQVMKLAGVKYFLTQKMSWSIYNKFPYHTFNWKGIDGTSVLAHMLPEDTYNSPMRGDFLVEGEKKYTQRDISDISMCLFGIGDGGAGPGYEHVERACRYKDLKGMPKVRFEKSMDFFNRLDDGTEYPTYSGELYLERHQGTYTTRAKNKWYNRKCEIAIKNYEMLVVLAKEKGMAVPVEKAQLDKIWQELLLYQFHDILPGSSINRVYDECEARYEIIYNKLINSADYLINALVKQKAVVNLNPYTYEKALKINGRWYRLSIPALGFAAVEKSKEITHFSAKCTYNSIENDKVRVEFKDGYVSSLFNKALDREFIKTNSKAAVISQYADNGDCWDIENCRADYILTKQDAVCTAFSTYTDGAKAGAVAEYKIGDCTARQEFYVIDGDENVYADLTLDVKQKNSMLRIAFPVNIKTDECKFNLQFGHISRPTTENNSIETAQFEVSGQKFVDMSERAFGISLINDCKYGYRCKDDVIDMNLVRSPKGGPGKNVDQGIHKIRYALFTHSGELSSETYKNAYCLNNPLIITDGEVCDQKCSQEFYNTDNDSIVLETVKPADDGRGIIARFYNSSEDEQTANVSIKGYMPAEIVDISENCIEAKNDDAITLHGFGLINIKFIKMG